MLFKIRVVWMTSQVYIRMTAKRSSFAIKRIIGERSVSNPALMHRTILLKNISLYVIGVLLMTYDGEGCCHFQEELGE